jgi:ATP-dependent DNA helicase RecG
MLYPQSESSMLEFKESIPSDNQIAKTIVGFCNHFGGKLILGVNNRREITGVSESRIEEILEYIQNYLYDSCSPVIIPNIYTQRFADKIILVIEVSPGMHKPYFLKSRGLDKGVYVRMGRSTLRADAFLIQELQSQSRGISFDQLPYYQAQPDVLNRKLMDDFFKARKTGARQKISIDILKSYHFVSEEHARTYPTNGALLLFAKEPQHYFSEAFIICTHYSGLKGRTALASVDCTGQLAVQFETAFEFIRSRLSKSFTITGKKRKELFEVPLVAIREVLLNAIVHRNYNIPGPIKIALYSDRIEFFSPGGFPGPISQENLMEGITYIRNRVVAKVFREMGYIEKLGTGFITLFTSYSEMGLKPPTVVEGENYIKCILPRIKQAARPSEEETVLRLLHLKDKISITDVVQALGVSRATAGRKLKRMVEKKILKKTGSGPAAGYVRY